MKILLTLFLIGMLLLPVSLGHIETFHPTLKTDFLLNGYQPDVCFNRIEQHQVHIDLDLYDASYGHELLWKANTTGTNYEESSVIYCDGVAYIGSCATHGDGHNRLFAVDTTSGEILWSTPTGPGYVGPVIDGNRVYFGTSTHGHDPENEYMYCINASDGSILWERNIYGGIPESIQYDEDNIYFTTYLIYALDKYDGSTQWTYQMDDFSVTKPILKDHAFITATSGGTMYKVDVTDGSPIWNVTLSGFSWDNSITADGNGRIYLALYQGRTMNAYDEYTGDLLWTYRLHGNSLSFNAYHDNVVFISDTAGYVYALNVTTGTLIWEKKLGDTFDISSPSISGGFIVIGTRDFEDGAFFMLDEHTGETVWKHTIGASITAPPTIADGVLLCGTDDWHMYAFDLGIGSGDWVLSRYDASNTAYSPNGLLQRHYVAAACMTDNNITICTVTNIYDHIVHDIKLQLPAGITADWYDASNTILQSDADHLIIDQLESQSLILITIVTGDNLPPSTPILSGPSSGQINVEHMYNAYSIDPDDELLYLFEWGDGSNSGWIGPFLSAEQCSASHIWDQQGSYTIRCKAKDNHGIESPWSEPLPVSMPRYHYTFYDSILSFLSFILSSFLP